MSLPRLAARVKRGALPSLWLVTDEVRSGDVAAAMRRLPRGAGVIFRHYDAPDRTALASRLRRLARGLGLIFVVARDVHLATRVRADGFHAPEGLVHRLPAARAAMPRAILTAAAHSEKAIRAAERYGADSIFLSPVFATRSHPGGRTLGVERFAALASNACLPVIALGGINATRARRLTGTRVAGFAAIDALGG